MLQPRAQSHPALVSIFSSPARSIPLSPRSTVVGVRVGEQIIVSARPAARLQPARSRCPAAPDTSRRGSTTVGWYTRTLKARPSPTSSRANHIAPRTPLCHTAWLLHIRYTLAAVVKPADSHLLPVLLPPPLLDCIATYKHSIPATRHPLTATHLPTLSTTSPLPPKSEPRSDHGIHHRPCITPPLPTLYHFSLHSLFAAHIASR